MTLKQRRVFRFIKNKGLDLKIKIADLTSLLDSFDEYSNLSNTHREQLIRYEIKTNCCSDKEAEIRVDGFLSSILE